MAHHTKPGHEEGNRWAVGVETETKSAGILSYIILGGGGGGAQADVPLGTLIQFIHATPIQP
jgi:hypothetical protein